MQSYIENAERIYKSLYNRNIIALAKSELLNLMIEEISKDMLGRNSEVTINSIKFKQGFKNESIDGWANLDISLIPSYESEHEFILWLAGFIDKVCVGVNRVPPALMKHIPCEYTYNRHKIKDSKRNQERKNKYIAAFKAEINLDTYKRELI